MDTILQLPRDVIANILSRLSVKYLVQLKCVCKPLQSLISDPYFARLQLSQSKNNGLNCDRLLFITVPLGSAGCEAFDGHNHGLDHVNHHEYPAVMNKILKFEVDVPDIEIGGSCHGMICVSFDNEHIFLWNPTMREALELPNIGDFNPLNVIYGLGYDSSIDDYKLLRGRCHPLEGNYHFEILALKSNTCRNIEVGCNFDYYFHEKLGIFSRGGLHWIPNSLSDPKKTPVILSFHMVEEKFCKVVELPDSIEKTENVDLSLKKSEDGFFLFYADYLRCDLVAWRLNEYGVKSSWTKFFWKYGCNVLSCLRWWRVVHYTETGKIIFDYGDSDLIYYNPEDDSWKVVNVQSNLEWFQRGIYVESLVSPNRYRPTSA